MLTPKPNETEDERIDRTLDAAAERLAEVLLEHWDYEQVRRRKKERRSKPLGA